MPVTNRGGLPGADYNYLKAQPPSWESVRTGLSIFALVIIARYCVQTIYRWLRPAQRRDSASFLPTNNPPLQRQHKPHIGPMDDEKSIQGVSDQHEDLRAAAAVAAASTTTTNTASTMADRHSHWRGAGGALPGPFISRLPPAPPLTPPELSTAVFTLDNEPSPSSQSFIHQPNPDYMSSTSTTAFQTGSPDAASIPRRRSYTRTLPISAPGAHSPQAQSPKAESVDPIFLPSSYPPSSGLLPPAPPSGLDLDLDDHGHRNVDVHGEILSVLDRDGAGWTRHTRVYGGGTCLACAANGGGFYGATVTPEEMR
ncbi:hypothetical protein BBK36DRAFT_1113241 [Trichoderma citrinoviride]|uniref:Uncharacterized protein n=1 Tax=Trichoderma citrinoviride TaxID=58853 RepID=A0A2T4BGP2_9HYPO|nr:hypothetical protein BBK36DRAFT_1113241 [Trichoderma citrinoviride]PTB68494.1 hypothetical protein BBK36DRAFT_1113241 [Trichoderma citrinoviride]